MKTRPGVYFAEVDGEAVVLDLHTNRYFGLSATSAAVWRGLDGGCEHEQVIGELRRLGVPEARLDDVIRRQREIWLATGLVDASQTTSAIAAALPRSRAAGGHPRAALDSRRLAATKLRARDLWRAGIEAMRVRWTFRTSGATHAIRTTQTIDAEHATDDAPIYGAVKACQTLRRPFRQGLADCVYRSIVLSRLLRRRGVDAAICIGVRKLPFVAHAWVEVDGTVINESLDVARSFTRLVEF